MIARVTDIEAPDTTVAAESPAWPAADAAPGAPPATTAAAVENPLPEDRYLNRELSWLDFNARVLALAEDTSLPLLERAKFLAIFASNLDEFYMVRVAGLKRRDEMGLSVRSADGLTPREQLRRIGEQTQKIATRHAEVFLNSVEPALAAEGIRIATWADLDQAERDRLSTYFTEQVFPVLTPLAVDPAHPFPFVSGLSLNLAVTVKQPDDGGQHFARVKVPDNVDRFVELDDRPGADDSAGPKEVRFLPMEELIAAFLTALFPGMEIVEHHAFRVTRNADYEVDEDRDEDLLQALERELARRRFGSPVRLEVADDMTEHMLELLLRELDVHPGDVIQVPGLLDLSSLWQIYGVDRPALKDPAFVPATSPAFADRETPKSIFATLREGDVLVHHPYDSFSTSTQRFIELAAADPNVLAIKQTLYRTSGDSPIVRVADRSRRSRKASRGSGRDQGPVRRAGQHQVGPRAGAGGSPRGLRAGRFENALQDMSGGAPRRLDDPALLPHRHRQLQQQDGPAVRGPRPADRRPRHRRRPDRSVQHVDRIFTQGLVPQSSGRTARYSQRHHRTRQPGDRRARAKLARGTSG